MRTIHSTGFALIASCGALLFPLPARVDVPRVPRVPAPRFSGVRMGPRTPEQRAAYSGAKDTADPVDLRIPRTAIEIKIKLKHLIIVVVLGTAAGVCAPRIIANRPGMLRVLQPYLTGCLTAAHYCQDVVWRFLKVVFRMATSSAVGSLVYLFFTKVIEFCVPAFAFLFVFSSFDDEESTPDPDDESSGFFKKLFKGDRSSAKEKYVPKKQYVRIEPLREKLSSMAYTVQAATASKAEAARAQRRRELSRRFGDELGNVGIDV